MMICVPTARLLFFCAFCFDRAVSFTPKAIWAHQTRKPCQQFAYSDSNEEGSFESLVEEATFGATGLYGGDFAGLAATFNPGDGSFIPIPDYLIPEDLKEWGQEPKCLQVLVSEDVHDDGSGESCLMSRVTTKILPETGCGVDNMETMIASDEIDLESQWKSDDDNDGLEDVVGLQYPLGEEKLRVETIFGLEEEYGVDRIRVAIDLIPSEENFAIVSPMVLTLERRTSSISSGGTIAEGGGLDGRTVYMLLGERLRSETTFVDEPSMSNENYYDTGNDIRYVGLPANISIAFGWLNEGRDTWMLQVSHITSNGSRRVVSRQFTVASNNELDFEIRSWVEDL